MINPQEAAFIKAFIVKDKQERYLQILANPRRRRHILDRLNHFFDFDPGYASLIPKELRTVDKMAHLLTAHGAGKTCHVIADSLDCDGQDLPLRDALAQVIAHDFGSVLCCLSGQLAFHKAEAIEEAWYVLVRQPR